MKKLNNKGMTLMELLVSVVLISVIMIFMYKLIADVRNEKKKNDKITDNILKISEVQVDFYNKFYETAPKEADTFRLWNDIWVSKNQDKVLGHWVRIDVGKTGEDLHQFQIGVSTNAEGKVTMQLRKWGTDSITGTDKFIYSDKQTFEGISDVDIFEECKLEGTETLKDLVCIIEFHFLDANKKVMYSLDYPFYWKTKAFMTDSKSSSPANSTGYGTFAYDDRINERICTYGRTGDYLAGITDPWDSKHCYNAFNYLSSSTYMKYKKRFTEIPRVTSLTYPTSEWLKRS